MTGTAAAAAPRPISAVIITRDADAHLAAVLAAADVCGERLVLDSGSVDETLAIAAAAAARVERHAFLGFGPQKQLAVSLAAHDWILSLDADEVLDAEARAAILSLDLSDPTACWQIRRRTFIGDREVRHGVWRNEQVLRLFNRTTAAFKPLAVHEQVVAARRPRSLPGSILHYSYAGAADVIAKTLRYAPLKAALIRATHERPAAFKLPARGLTAFLKTFVIQQGWRDGAAGFVVALARVLDATLPRVLVLLGEAADRGPADGSGTPPFTKP
jgi:glycosyltransferase involved in cell wall biosynthesis